MWVALITNLLSASVGRFIFSFWMPASSVYPNSSPKTTWSLPFRWIILRTTIWPNCWEIASLNRSHLEWLWSAVKVIDLVIWTRRIWPLIDLRNQPDSSFRWSLIMTVNCAISFSCISIIWSIETMAFRSAPFILVSWIYLNSNFELTKTLKLMNYFVNR